MNQLRWSAMGLAAAGAAGLAFASGIASAAPAPPPRFVGGNVTTCKAAGLSGSILFSSADPSADAGSGTESGNRLFLDVTINSGYTASGVVVKGGPNANVYEGPFTGPVTIEDMRAPNNPGGQQPQISHWYVCGAETPTTPKPTTKPPTTAPTTKPPTTAPTTKPPTTAPTTKPPTTAPTTKPPTTAPTVAPTTVAPTTAAPTDVPTTPPATTPPPKGGELPTTGARLGLFVGSAIALLGSGVLLFAFARQRRRFVA